MICLYNFKFSQRLEEDSQAHGELRVKYQKIIMEHSEMSGRVKHDDYKVENYDRVKG